ncbi:glycoside hydrolase family 26 protein [Microlunatus ginsengisoli]|uniref:GH26 domain-containing protein n=1 Tax=Microlunatus ginsengisoli TaxID=363863 RepID=A0ABP6ZE67_9ACTN
MTRPHLWARAVACLAGLFCVIAGPACSAATPRGSAATTSTTVNKIEWGVYTGPGAKGVNGATSFAAKTGIPVVRVLDFLPDDSWSAMTGADWLINAHRGTPYHLELSVPLLPRTGATLSACASGSYNQHWRTIAKKLVAAGLGDSTIRAGWEFNGSWYTWSAKGKVGAFIGCYRQLVTTMRAAAPKLTFSWTVNNGSNAMSADEAWPGPSYVDVIGVDVYDYDYRWYPPAAGTTMDQARTESWKWALHGTRGLRYWSAFAAARNKPLALAEWGLAWRSDGHAGGDNAIFVNGILDFVYDPTSRVQYATYFNNNDSTSLKHNVTAANQVFPTASKVLSQRVKAGR